jgi:hypothetical protein
MLLSLGLWWVGPKTAPAQAATLSEYQIYLPLVIRNFPQSANQSLTVSKSGNGSGSVTSNPAGIDCGVTCSASFPGNTSVTLTTIAGTGSSFTGWSGSGCSGTNTCTLTMDASKVVTASFALNAYQLSVGKDGSGSGTVTSNPPGINCGATCSAIFDYHTSVTLTAVAGTGSTFSGWNDGNCPTNGTCTVTMDAAKSIIATFNVASFEMRVGTSGTGSGTVTSSPAGINCGSTCISSFDFNTVVTLTATPTSPSTFGGWSGGGCSGTGTCQVTMNADYGIIADFILPCNGIANCGFEAGSNGQWTEYSAHGLPLIFSCEDPANCFILNGIPPHSGSFLAWLGGDNNETSYLQQQVYISSDTPYLAYWQWIESPDFCGFNYDYTEVFINGLIIEKYDLCTDTNTTDWVPHNVDLGTYAGQSVTLRISVKTDNDKPSNLYLDDVSLLANPLSP